MRYLLFIFFLFFGLNSSVFAVDILSFGLEPESIELGETAILRLQIYSTGSLSNPKVEIAGLNRVPVFSTSQSFVYSLIDSETRQSIEFAYELEPADFGPYTFGPITITTADNGSELFENEIVLNVGNVTASQQSKQEEVNKNIEYQGGDQAEDIKGLRSTSFPVWWFIGALFVFCIGMYLLLRQVLFSNTSLDSSTQINGEEKSDIFSELLAYFQNLRQESSSLSSQAFFQKMNEGVRNIWNAEGIGIPESATLKEMKKYDRLKNHPLFLQLFSESYFSEFSSRDVSSKQREKYLDILENYLRSKIG